MTTIATKIAHRLATICIFVGPLILGLYLVKYAVADFSSDAAMNSVLARVMYDAGTVFPKDWIISNGEGPFPSTAMLIAPLLAYTSNGVLIPAIISLILAALLVWSYWLFLGLFERKPYLQALGFIILTMGISYPFVRMVYVETAYFWWPFCFFICAYLAVKYFQEGGLKYFYLCAVVLFLFGLKNPQRVIIMITLPLMAFVCFLGGKNVREILNFLGANKKYRAYLGTIVASAIASLGVAKWLVYAGLINDLAVVTGLHFAGIDQIWINAKIFVNGWFLYLGSDAEIYAYQSFEPFFRALRSTFAVLVTILAWLGAFTYIRSNQAELRALAASFFISFLLVFVLYIFTTSLAINHLTMRYFTIPYLLALALAIAYAIEKFSSLTSFSLVASIFIVVTTVSGYARLIPCPAMDCNVRVSGVMAIADMLEKEGLRFGYANWWVAGAPTIISKEQVLVAPMNVSAVEISPFNYMVDSKWYTLQAQKQEKFLMLFDREATPDLLAMLKEKYGSWKREIRSAGMVVLVFDSSVIFFN